ncbi:MAG: hypothetical protein LBH98_04940 [Chitinispirillales bacterium]|nr:hypothetical protein [Chitinispirillales bacterium]
MNKFDLAIVADRLEALEETIIFRILDRAQYKLNSAIYLKGAFLLPSQTKGVSLLDYMHKFIEQVFAQLGRFTTAEEKPFFESTTWTADIGVAHEKETLCEDALKNINLTAKIKEHYGDFVNDFCDAGDDGEYGSAAEADVSALVAISKRIHYGSFYVAESKFSANPKAYVEAAKIGEYEVKKLLVRREVEKKIAARVAQKCNKIQSAYTSKFRRKIDRELIESFYVNTIIPLTVSGEAEYIFRRCKSEN